MAYNCFYCGKSYNTPEEMAECTLKCSKEKNENELNELYKEIHARYQDLKNLVNSYNEKSNDNKLSITFTSAQRKKENCSKECNCNNKINKDKNEKIDDFNLNDFDSVISDFLNCLGDHKLKF